MLRKYAFLPFLLLLFGCATLGVPDADTFNKKALAAYSTVEAARNTTNTLAAAGKLSKPEATNAQAKCDNAKEAITIARSLYVSNPQQATDKLTAAIALLQALNNYLVSKQS